MGGCGRYEDGAYAKREVAALRKKAAELEARAVLIDALELPTDVIGALELARAAYPHRLRFLDSAERSAKAFTGGKPAEVWSILRSMALVLHPLVFDRSESCDIAAEFERRTGYEIALRDVKMQKANADLSRSRQAHYKGAWRDATAHVKGRSRKVGFSLRVHFFADYEERVLVVTHCGDHLSTIESSRI